MSASRVVVTGAAGFVGTHLTQAMASEGAAVVGVGIRPAGDPTGPGRWIDLDVRDAAAVEAALAGERPEVIVHLAGQSSAGRSFEAPVDTFGANVLGTWTLLETARRVTPAARVLVVGTGEVYGPTLPGTRSTEDSPFNPVSPYAMSKAVADVIAGAFHTAHGLDVVRTRSFSHTGPGQTPTFALPSFARQIARIERGLEPPVLRVGNLEVVRDILDVADVVRAYLDLIGRGRSGGVYNVCRGTGIALSDAVRSLISFSSAPIRIEIDSARFRPADVAYLVGSPERLMRESGWSPARSMEDTLRGLLESWRSRLKD